MNAGARTGDLVRVFLQGGDSYAIEGTVTYTPQATGDSWVIVSRDGDIFNVMMFEFMKVVSRKADTSNGRLTDTPEDARGGSEH